MKALYGLYADPEAAQRAVDALRAASSELKFDAAADRHCLRRAPRGLRIRRLARHRQSLIAGRCWARPSAARAAIC